jgi:hypothetical protein
MDLQCAVAASGVGVDLGAAALITGDTVDAIHDAADTLERMLRAAGVSHHDHITGGAG